MNALLGCAAWLVWMLVACESAPPGEETPSRPSTQKSPHRAGAQTKDAPPVGKRSDEGMRVVLLGTGTPIPDPHRAGPATAVLVGGRAYLVDAGPGLVRRAEAARRAGWNALDPTQLDRLFLTHLHSDHTVGVADVLRSPAVVGRITPLEVYGPEGTAAMVEHLRQAYAVDQRIRFAVEGERAGYAVEAHDIEQGLVYRDEHVEVRALRVQHGSFEHAFGYRFEADGRRVVVSGDTTASEAVVQACDGCDVLVHEVYCAAGLAELEPSVRRYHQRFHTSTHELAALATRARPRLLVLTHLLFFGCSPLDLLAEVRAGYPGEVALGEDLGVY